jgi:hypothetical protein
MVSVAVASLTAAPITDKFVVSFTVPFTVIEVWAFTK